MESGAGVVRKFASRRVLDEVWHRKDTPLVLRNYHVGTALETETLLHVCCAGSAQALRCWCIGTVPVLDWCCTSTGISGASATMVLYLVCTDARLMLHWCCAGTSLALHKYWAGTVMVLQRCCAGTVLSLYPFCSSNLLAMQQPDAGANTIHIDMFEQATFTPAADGPRLHYRARSGKTDNAKQTYESALQPHSSVCARAPQKSKGIVWQIHYKAT